MATQVGYLQVILGEPDGGKVTPSELSDDNVSIVVEGVPNADRVVSSRSIILQILLVFGHDGCCLGSGE